MERLTGIEQKLKWVYRIPTFLFILIGWVLFRSESLTLAKQYFTSMFTGMNGFADFVFWEQLRTSYPVLILAVLGCTPLLKTMFAKLPWKESVKNGLLLTATITMFILSLLAAISSTHNPFLYFNF